MKEGEQCLFFFAAYCGVFQSTIKEVEMLVRFGGRVIRLFRGPHGSKEKGVAEADAQQKVGLKQTEQRKEASLRPKARLDTTELDQR